MGLYGLLEVELICMWVAGFQLPIWKLDEDLYDSAGGGR